MKTRPDRLWVLIDSAGLALGRAGIDEQAFDAVSCLFTGDLETELADCAPYLALINSVENKSREALEFLANGNCAVVLTDSKPTLTFADAHRHFRKFNVVYGPDGTPLFFRYYDGRTLHSVLRALDATQLASFFGPFDTILLPIERGTTSRLELVETRLASSIVDTPLYHLVDPIDR